MVKIVLGNPYDFSPIIEVLSGKIKPVNQGPIRIALGCFLLLSLLTGCDESMEGSLAKFDMVYGELGVSDGRFKKPRSMTIDPEDRIYTIDMTARIQVFNPDGKFLRSWSTPDHSLGRPTGLNVNRDGNLLVADTHYFQILIYSPEGEIIQKIGGVNGLKPGEFGFVTDCIQGPDGFYYVSEYGEFDRIQKFTSDGEFVMQFGGHGSEPGQFLRPQSIAMDRENQIWVADSANHRVQVFDREGKLIKTWGTQGSGEGELSYPYDIIFDKEGNLLICEYGNNRVQKFTPEGKSLGMWGESGKKTGQLFNPWSIVQDKAGRLHVLDSNNHRIQRIVLNKPSV